MPYPVESLAKFLCEKSGWSLTNLQLQKLVYIAQMYHLGRTGKPLVDGYFEAWDYGPVHPHLYHKLKVFGSSPVKNYFSGAPAITENDAREAAEKVWNHMGTLGAGQLVAITHWPEGAWAGCYSPGRRGIVIGESEIRDEYLKRVKSNGK